MTRADDDKLQAALLPLLRDIADGFDEPVTDETLRDLIAARGAQAAERDLGAVGMNKLVGGFAIGIIASVVTEMFEPEVAGMRAGFDEFVADISASRAAELAARLKLELPDDYDPEEIDHVVMRAIENRRGGPGDQPVCRVCDPPPTQPARASRKRTRRRSLRRTPPHCVQDTGQERAPYRRCRSPDPTDAGLPRTGKKPEHRRVSL